MSTQILQELQDIQGYALSGYGHLTHAKFVFLHIQDAAQGKAWLKEIIPSATTAEPWPSLADGRRVKPRTTLNIAFTYKGLAALRLPQDSLNSFPQEYIEDVAARADVLGDTGGSSPEHWEIGGPNGTDVHVLLILYGESQETLETALDAQRSLRAKYRTGIVEIAAEDGHRPPSGKEHFGFHDGIGQPDVEGVQRGGRSGEDNEIKLGEILLGYMNGYGMYAPSPTVLAIHDPDHVLPSFPEDALPRCRDFGRNGSFLVYRKLAQDVAGFWGFIEEKAGGRSGEMIRFASKLVGRWPSGAPITLSPDGDDLRLADQNRFGFTPQDSDGDRCPIGAHIRRVNPRDSLQNDTPAESYLTCSRHRIVRRGISYGEPLFVLGMTNEGEAPAGLRDDGKPRGLHFVVLNASISRQFEFIQQTWCNNTQFQALFDEKDPIIGDNDGEGHMTMPGRPYRKRISDVRRFVSVKGAAYLFLPSISAMRFIAS